MFDRTNGPIVRTAFQSADANGDVYYGALMQNGIIPSARLVMSGDASNNDTIAIGATTFKFVTTLGAAAAQVQVKRGVSAAATLAGLVKAINGTTDATTWVEATTPFAASILADSVTTSLRIRQATKRGGRAIPGVSPSIALVEAITAAADIWNVGNMNESGKDPGDTACAVAKFAVGAQMITNGSYQLELPFTPTVFEVDVRSSTGVLRSSNEAVTISSNALNFVMAGGATPNLQAGDIVTVTAIA